jgi:hypothetical protein
MGFLVKYFFTVTTLPPSQFQTIGKRELRTPSDYERLDALHSRVDELQRTVDALSRKNPSTKNRPLIQQSQSKFGWLPVARAHMTQKQLREFAALTTKLFLYF